VTDLLSVTVSGLLLAGLYATMSYGLTMIYGVMKIINLSQAGTFMLAAYVAFTLFTYLGLDPMLSLVIIVPAFFLFGMLLQRLFVSRVPLANTPTLPSLLLLFGIWLVLQNLAYMIWTGDDRSILTSYTYSTINFLGLQLSFTRVMVFLIGLLALFALQAFLTRTYTGKAIRALTQNRPACMLVGIDVDRIAMLAFGIGVAFDALAGTLMSLLYAFTPAFGNTFMLKAFVIIVLGGLQNYYGVAIGALVLALVESWAVMFMPASLQPAIAYTLLVIVLVLMPRGITGLLEGRRTV